MSEIDEHFRDKCAVIGLVNVPESAKYAYLSLYAMQHRGQEGAGIVSSDSAHIYSHKAMGLVADVFSEQILHALPGNAAIGHTRYATCGSKDWQNLQPLIASFSESSFAVAHNGNLVNYAEVKKELEASGSIFSSSSDTEVILHLIAKAQAKVNNFDESTQTKNKLNFLDHLEIALKQVRGAYSLVILTHESLYAVRDPAGIRPLSLGKLDKGYVVASETCALDLIGAEFVRDIEPGEILEIGFDGEIKSSRFLEKHSAAFCIFEYIYFARPDSNFANRNVYQVRKRLGEQLAVEAPVEADVVIPVPDSGVSAAIGYASKAKLPLEFGLIRNHYIGRTFIEPQQSIRDFGVKIKLNANAAVLKGKRVVVIDDSIVRGTTCKKIIKMLRAAGAKEIHFRISSPPTISPCYYGIDTPSESELIGANYTVEQIKDYIGADSLSYLSLEGMHSAVDLPKKDFCAACFTKDYPIGVSDIVKLKGVS